MAAQTELSILIRIKDEASDAIEKLGGSLHSLENSIGPAANASRVFGLALLGVGTAAAAGAVVAVNAFAKKEAAITRMGQLLKVTVGATDEHVQAMVQQAKALERVGVVSEDMIVTAQGQLATFNLQTNTIQSLIPALLDMAVSERGVNVNTEQMISMANGLGKALQGQTELLSRMGFKFTEVQKSILETGTEQQRLTTLTEILNSTYQGMNETMRQTTAGSIAAMKTALGNLLDVVGEALAPAVTDLANRIAAFASDELPKWIEKTREIIKWLKDHKEIVMIVVGAIIGALVPAFIAAAITLITVTIPAFIAAAIALAPFMIAGAVIVGVVAGVLWIIKHWELIKTKTMEIFNTVRSYLSDVWNGIRSIFQSAIDYIMSKINGFLNAVNQVKSAASSVGSAIGSGASSAMSVIGLAEGGIVTRPTLALVGEAGEPEAVIPLSKLSGMGGNLTVVLQGTFMTAPEMAREYGRYLADEIKRQIRI